MTPKQEMISTEARNLLFRLLEVAEWQHEKGQPEAVGHVYTSDAFPAAEDVSIDAYHELIELATETLRFAPVNAPKRANIDTNRPKTPQKAPRLEQMDMWADAEGDFVRGVDFEVLP